MVSSFFSCQGTLERVELRLLESGKISPAERAVSCVRNTAVVCFRIFPIGRREVVAPKGCHNKTTNKMDWVRSDTNMNDLSVKKS